VASGSCVRSVMCISCLGRRRCATEVCVVAVGGGSVPGDSGACRSCSLFGLLYPSVSMGSDAMVISTVGTASSVFCSVVW
jgi:hypothetical protein